MPGRSAGVPTRLLAPLTAILLSLSCAGGRPHGHPRSPGPHLPLGEKPLSYEFRERYSVYPSGLRAVAIHVADARSTWVTVSYSLAGLADPPGKAGLAALAGLIADQGAMVRGGLRAGERRFALGALYGSRASPDELAFEARVRPGSLEVLLAIEATRLRDPAAGLEDEEVERVRERYARALERDPGDRQVLEALTRRALAGTAYARPSATPASIRAVTPGDVRGLLRAALRPERAVVVVIGPATLDRTLRTVERTFGEGGPAVVKPIASPAAPLPAAVATALERLPGRGEHRVLWLAWPVPGQGGRTGVIGHLVAQELVSTLAERAARPDLDPLVRWVQGDQLLHDGAGMIHVRAALSDDADVERVREALLEASAALGARFEDAATVRLQRRRRDIAFGMFRQIEEGVVAGIPELVRTLDQPNAAEVWNRQLDDAMYAVPAFLRAHIRADRAVGVLVDKAPRPEPGAEVTEAEPAWGRATSLLSAASPGASEVRALLEEPLPAIAERRTLANGLEVVVVPRGAFPTVHVALFVRGDSETPAARAHKRAALRAVERRSRWRLSRIREVPGGFELYENGPTAWLPYYIASVGCWTWTEPGPSGVREVAEAMVEADARGNGAAEGGPYGAVQEALLSPAGARVSLATPFARVRADAAVSTFPGWFRPDRATLVIAGKVTPSEALWNDVQDAVGGWKAEGPALVEPPAPPGPDRRRVLLFDYPDAQRAFATVIVRTPPRGARDEGAHRILASHLAEVGEQVAAPGGGSSWAGGRDGAWLSSVRVSFDGQDRELVGSVSGLLAELERLRAVPISPVDLDLARWSAARWEAFAHDDLPSLTAHLGEAALRGTSADALSLREPLVAATPATLHAYARQVLGRELVAVSGDARRLAPALKAAGLEPEVIPVPSPEAKRR